MRGLLGLTLLVWIAVLAAGIGEMTRFERTPGARGGSPLRWPVESNVYRSAEKPTLVMLVHPFCSCSAASLDALERIAARFGDRVAITVLFSSPTTEESLDTQPHWLRANSIPGVRVVHDTEEIEARRFGALTSGQTVLYDRDGSLLFSGGLTDARGRNGESRGSDAIDRLLTAQSPTQITAPMSRTDVFGCALFDPPATQEYPE